MKIENVDVVVLAEKISAGASSVECGGLFRSSAEILSAEMSKIALSAGGDVADDVSALVALQNEGVARASEIAGGLLSADWLGVVAKFLACAGVIQ